MSVEEVRVDFADAGKAIFNNPVFPLIGVFIGALTSFRSGPPDGIGQHGADGYLVWGDGSISTEEVVEEVDCGWWWQRE